MEIGISRNFKEPLISVEHVEAIAGKGLVNDRYFKNYNENRSQITLIEIENINYYNKVSESKIPAINFIRNIVTEGIKLNDLINSEFTIGEVKLKGRDLCRPCISLQKSLNRNDIVKKLLQTGGLRCESLSDGKIHVGDIIKTL